jgi:UTP--glucose-1-phosphate uridylyltransferase
MRKKLRKAVFPVGGLGTRFLPATKALPKEMLPVNSKPLIQHVFEEARAGGIEEFIFITGRNKNAISNHFDHSYELQNVLQNQNKQKELDLTTSWLPAAGSIAFIRQFQPMGLGHAIWCARSFIGNEPFAVLLADELLMSDTPMLKQMHDLYEEIGGNIIGVQKIEPSQSINYGMIATKAKAEQVMKIDAMIEKPLPQQAPSDLAIIGRYILQPEIFDILAQAKPSVGGEIQLTDAMNQLINTSDFHGLKFAGKRFDCGKSLGFLEANLAYAMANDDGGGIKEMLRKYII